MRTRTLGVAQCVGYYASHLIDLLITFLFQQEPSFLHDLGLMAMGPSPSPLGWVPKIYKIVRLN